MNRSVRFIPPFTLPARILFLALCFGCVLKSVAQEQLIPLRSNPALHATAPSARMRTMVDTLLLPFIDDFSREGCYPQPDRWVDSFAFVNTNYPDDPVTIGVATLDGLDAEGNPYNINAGQSDVADYLTSLPIDLSANPNDTMIWLSFFYQPQGLGDAPEEGDSLIVEFRSRTGLWLHKWSVTGREDTVFQRVNIRVQGVDFLYRGFQFRFKNYATINGNRDHWNIDYVILKTNTVANDSIRDNGFIRPRYSLLTEYESMPYTHYKSLASPLSAMVSDINDSIRNINYGPTSFIYTSTVSDASGNNLFSSSPSSLSGGSNSIIPFNTSLSGFSYPSTSADKAEFLMKNYVTITGTQSNLYNDTVKYHQVFDNYYAYDDGSAEIGYGITGNTGVKMAYEFDIKKADTLRAIDIYFNPTGVNISTQLFQLTVWDQVDVPTNSDHVLYREINQRPFNIDSINGFARYVLDTPQAITPGSIWIGFIQNNASLLIGLGLDRNTDRHQHMFYQVDGYWYASGVQGSWMMRPVFGAPITGPIGIAEVNVDRLSFGVYPQPASESITITGLHDLSSKHYSYRLLDIQGKAVQSGHVEQKISVENLSDGVYVLEVTDTKSFYSGTRRVVIAR